MTNSKVRIGKLKSLESDTDKVACHLASLCSRYAGSIDKMSDIIMHIRHFEQKMQAILSSNHSLEQIQDCNNELIFNILKAIDKE